MAETTPPTSPPSPASPEGQGTLAAPPPPAPSPRTPTAPPFRMEAYWYEFKPTGVRAIDWILSAVAHAGKAFHDTARWGDPDHDAPTSDGHRGRCPVEWIQHAAEDAASVLTSMEAEVATWKGRADLSRADRIEDLETTLAAAEQRLREVEKERDEARRLFRAANDRKRFHRTRHLAVRCERKEERKRRLEDIADFEANVRAHIAERDAALSDLSALRGALRALTGALSEFRGLRQPKCRCHEAHVCTMCRLDAAAAAARALSSEEDEG